MANTIWEMPKGNGEVATSFQDLSTLGTTYFKYFFKAPAEVSIAEVIRVAQLFPRFVEDEDNEAIMAPVSKQEVEDILKGMQKDKSPGPNDWTVEFFLHFFETLGDEIGRAHV